MKIRQIIFFILISIFIFSSIARAADSDCAKERKHINTSGNAKVWISPDRARIFLGVETLDQTIKDAREKNAMIINSVMEKLRSLPIKDIFIQSPTYNVSLIKEDEYIARKEKRIPQVVGYNVTQKFTVLLKNEDIEALSRNAGLVIDAALESGVNIIEKDILFFKEDVSREKENALKLAIQDAIAKAKVMAETAGVSIKEYSAISSGFSFGDRFNRQMQMTQVALPVSSEGDASTVLAAKISVEANVSMTCLLK